MKKLLHIFKRPQLTEAPHRADYKTERSQIPDGFLQWAAEMYYDNRILIQIPQTGRNVRGKDQGQQESKQWVLESYY
jgi:hypothetical protein